MPVRAALARLDQVDLPRVLQQRCLFFQSPPKFLRGPFRAALSLALRAIDSARPDNETEQTQAWILWLLLPRLLLHRRPGTHRLTKPEWRARLVNFQAGRWEALLESAAACVPATTGAPPPAAPADPARRAERAARLASFQLRVLHWFLDPWPRSHPPPWPSYRTAPGGPTSRTTPSILQFWLSNLSSLSCSQLPQCLAICGGLGKEPLPAPPVTQRSSAVWRWMARRLVPRLFVLPPPWLIQKFPPCIASGLWPGAHGCPCASGGS